MKRLYALLVILIVIFVGVNLVYNLVGDNMGNVDVGDNVTGDVVSVGASSFSALANFSGNPVNDTTVSLVDGNGMTINVSEIDNSESIEAIYNNFILNTEHTATETIDQNGVTAYFVYNTGAELYDADIFFNKNGQNYLISGDGIPLSNSDYFINHCKSIIDTIDITSTN